MEAVTADTFEQAIDKIRQGIVGKTNQDMSRLKVYQQIRQGMQKFGPWYKEVLKQAKSLLLFSTSKNLLSFSYTINVTPIAILVWPICQKSKKKLEKMCRFSYKLVGTFIGS